jgi:hypothetical protein
VKHTPKPAIFLAVLVALYLAAGALAMSSANYRMDWYELQPGASGATAKQSSSHQLRDSVGAPLVITMNSSQHRLGLGYWQGVEVIGSLYLPMVSR